MQLDPDASIASEKDLTMSPKETVMALYRAYGTSDERTIERLLHESVTWVAPAGNATQVALGIGKPEDAGLPAGTNTLNREQIVRFMARNFPRFFTDRTNVFRCIAAEGSFVFVEHRLSARLPNGRNYANDYCFVYEVKDGQVVAIREYMDTRGGWVQVFGDQEASQLIEYL